MGEAVIITSPSELPFLVDTFKSRGLRPKIPFFMTVGAALNDNVRALAEDYFGSNIISWYGSQEIGPSAIECKEHKSFYHILSDRVVLEILDEEKRPVPNGASGEITVTCLDNTVMPLLRYQLGDIGVLHDGMLCTCKNTSPLLEILQRNTDVVRFSDGHSLSASFILNYFKREPFVRLVRRFQIRQDALDAVKIVFEVREPVPTADLEKLRQAIRAVYRHDIHVDTEETTFIVPEGKKFKVFVPLPQTTI
jgi:phenylacetate-CoA ligase